MHIRNLEVGYQSSITAPPNIEVTRDHIAIIGPNGLERLHYTYQTIANRQKALGGEITYGANLKHRILRSKQAEFKSNKTILDYVWDRYPMMNEKMSALF